MKCGEASEATRVPQLLVADAGPSFREAISETLMSAGYRVEAVANAADVLRKLRLRPYDIVISDTKLDGLTLSRRVRREFPHTDVVLMSSSGNVHEALEALRTVTSHYIAKPFEPTVLLRIVDEIVSLRRVSSRPPPGPDTRSKTLVGQSPFMLSLRDFIATIGSSDSAVVIVGESGTGKELAARELHRCSPRRAKPFVAINCAAFPESLIESELFGHERGAFTGATQRRPGRFMAANGGTLLLDEVAELPLPVQAKLLRVLQERAFQPLGTNRTESVDVRVLSATNADLGELVKQGRFRQDLYYRLKVFRIHMKPLRERPADLPALVAHFLSTLESEGGAHIELRPSAWAALRSHSFPGNVRELKHAIEHAAVLSTGGLIERRHLPDEICGDSPEEGELNRPSLTDALAEFEREYLLRILNQVGWQRRDAARLLGISRKTLWTKIRAYGLQGRSE